MLTQFGIVDESEVELAMAMHLTDEISVLLMQQGIDTSTVNRLSVPAGFSSVGSMSILCYLPPQLDWTDRELWAVAGPVKWKLSKNYRIHRVFANQYSDNLGVILTLSVITFDDWRHDLNLDGTGTTKEKIEENSYASDFSVYNPLLEDSTEDDGSPPYEFAELDGDDLHLYFGPNGDPEIPSLSDPWNVWGYDTGLSRAEFVDRTLSACGVIAIPYLLFRGGAESDISYGQAYDIARTENQWMVAEYIGEGWLGATVSWDNLNGFYTNGQLECAFGAVEDFSDALNATDEMSEYLSNVPEQPTATGWTGHPKDGTQEVPSFVNVQFPAMTPSGQIILYRFESIPHGLPIGEQVHLSADEVTLTDHIKTQTNTNLSGDILNTSGITEIIIDPAAFDEVPGIDEERVTKLAERALEISRTYYARYFACTGIWSMLGHHWLRPWSGCLSIEYGFRNGVPYTTVSGDLDDPRFGFSRTSLGKTTSISSGGAMLARPDGMVDLALSGATAVSSDVLAEITGVTLSSNACTAVYDIKRLSDGVTWEMLPPTSREIPNMCYTPASVGDLCLFAVSPTAEDPSDPLCGQGVCEYILIINEKVKTIECM